MHLGSNNCKFGWLFVLVLVGQYFKWYKKKEFPKKKLNKILNKKFEKKKYSLNTCQAISGLISFSDFQWWPGWGRGSRAKKWKFLMQVGLKNVVVLEFLKSNEICEYIQYIQAHWEPYIQTLDWPDKSLRFSYWSWNIFHSLVSRLFNQFAVEFVNLDDINSGKSQLKPRNSNHHEWNCGCVHAGITDNSFQSIYCSSPYFKYILKIF